MTASRAFAGALAALATVGIAVILGPGLLRSGHRRPPLPGNFRSPAIALELAQSPQDVHAITEEPGSRRNRRMRSGVNFDFFVIAFYSVFYLALCSALARRRFFGAVWLAAAAAVAVVGGALFDVLENFRLFAVLDLPTASPEMPMRLADLAAATEWKWGLLFTALLFLSANFFRTERPWENLVGTIFVAAGMIGLWGVWHSSPAIESGFTLLVLGIVAVAFAWVPTVTASP